jgi:hypothetical protein
VRPVTYDAGMNKNASLFLFDAMAIRFAELEHNLKAALWYRIEESQFPMMWESLPKLVRYRQASHLHGYNEQSLQRTVQYITVNSTRRAQLPELSR